MWSAPAAAQPSRQCSAADVEPIAHDGGWPSPLDTLVTLRARGVSLRDALDRLGATSGVPLAYSSDLLPLDRPVCVVAERQPLGLVLATLLAGTNVQAQVVAHKVVLAPTAGPREAAPAKVSVLERVIVTGSAVGASRRPFAVGVEVIDGDELRLGGVGGLASALDAYVPGLWLWDQAPGSLVAQYGGVRGASSFSTSYPKMYIDGIEVANPLLVTQLNPDAVEINLHPEFPNLTRKDDFVAWLRGQLERSPIETAELLKPRRRPMGLIAGEFFERLAQELHIYNRTGGVAHER